MTGHVQGVDINTNVSVPLRKWIQDEAKQKFLNQLKKDSDQTIHAKKQALLRKTTVAYGIVELLRHRRILSTCHRLSTASICLDKECNVDNFIIHIFNQNETLGNAEQTQWNNVRGVSMVSPVLSAQIAEPVFLSTINDDHMEMGTYLEVHITPPLPNKNNYRSRVIAQTSNSNDCHLFGVLLYELCTGICPFSAESVGSNNMLGSTSQKELKKKRATVRYDKKKGKSYSTLQTKPYTPLQELGFPSSISFLVQNLIDGHDAYSSLDPVSSDIHLLNNDPDCFLFDIEHSVVSAQGSSMQLQIKKDKLYGREKQVSLITDAFCRVSSGKSEAFFIGGYSGSGKTMLVQSLTARVDASGGYVITQKADQMSKERPLLDVLSAFNNLCLLIRGQNSPRELEKVKKQIMHDFESDFSVLSRLLPNIGVLFPQLNAKTTNDKSIERVTNLQNVCHTLQRFMRIVSSRQTPVMLFLDDLQWAGSTALELIQALLSDTRGSTCFFFVGSYRDNEVHDGHPIFDLMSSLDSCGVVATKEHLGGLNRNDLNMMISDSMCIFPRLCKPLSDIIFEKTKGSPYFALEFLRSLVDSRLLKYSLRERRWIWDEDKIRSENITDNVLYLLSTKMSSLPENTRLALKLVSCFGIKADENIVGYLSSISQYSDLEDWLDQAINEGYIQKHENKYKFIHDKVREAAYNLIDDSDKSQFHYDLGILLYSTSKGQDLKDAFFQVVDQVNHGIPSLVQPKMQIDIAELNFSAGIKAVNFSDFETAYSYLNYVLPLLPKNHWNSHYDFSLRMFLLRAKATYSCGNIEEAYDLLKEIIENGRCIEDTLDAHYLRVTILFACEEREEAYITCREVLSQLKERIPKSLGIKELTAVIQETGGMLARMSVDDLSEMKETENTSLQFTLKFYTLSCFISYFSSSHMLPFFCCRMVRLTLKHGVCQESVFGLAMYCAVICQSTKRIQVIREMGRVGRAVMALLKRFDSSAIMPMVYSAYYGYVEVHTAPLQLCTDNLRKGFKVAISSGKYAYVAFLNSIHIVRTAFLSGQHLSTLLTEIDYYLQVMAQFRNNLSIPYLTAYRETISILIDKGQSAGSWNEHDITINAVYAQRCKETVYFNKSLQSFWLGHTQRFTHYSKKLLEIQSLGSHNRLTILFYAALNAFRGVKNNARSGSKFTTAKLRYKEAISALKPSAELSPLNFSNKVHLLEAEMLALEGKPLQAKSSYAASITSFCSVGYVQEHGLACELAGNHYKRIGEAETALDFFEQSRRSYMGWGSKMKVDFITQKIENIHRN